MPWVFQNDWMVVLLPFPPKIVNCGSHSQMGLKSEKEMKAQPFLYPFSNRTNMELVNGPLEDILIH